MILVTGATGNNGLERGAQGSGGARRASPCDGSRIVIARVRVAHCQASKSSPGTSILPETLLNALAGEQAFLLTSSSERAEARVCQCGGTTEAVSSIVKLSQFAAAANSPVRFLRYRTTVETRNQASGWHIHFCAPTSLCRALNFRSMIATQKRLLQHCS